MKRLLHFHPAFHFGVYYLHTLSIQATGPELTKSIQEEDTIMKRNLIVTLITLVLVLALAAPAFAKPPEKKTIVDIAASDPQFSILVEAVVAAGLADTLSGKGQYTVFAPTNAAFASLLGELGVSKEQLLADKDTLTQVLLYHVARGKRNSNAVTNGQQIRTLQGGFIYTDGTVLTDQRGRTSNIIAADIKASNGIIHVINTVVLP